MAACTLRRTTCLIKIMFVICDGKGIGVWVSALIEVCGVTDIWVFRRRIFVDERVEDDERFG